MNYPMYVGEYSDDRTGFDEEVDEEVIPWIVWFCEMKSHEFFCVVDRDFIDDEFNLTGLSSMVSFYHYALDLILDLETQSSSRLTEEQQRLVESSAETLYGLIHARFITTPRGLKLMEEKFVEGEFGRCPRVFCGGQAVLPVGQSDVVRESSVKLFCPKCQDIYYPRSSRHRALDGAFWGTTFPHLFLMHLRENGKVIGRPKQQYIPRIYGFRLHNKEKCVRDEDVERAGSVGGGAAGADEGDAEEEEEQEEEEGSHHQQQIGGEGSTRQNTPNSRKGRSGARGPRGEPEETPKR
ncbi:Casein kinase II subunit beta, putative [Trypanosoma equiperdum]|uniref:Casein kinase II subunit beta n=4 Tax=Trypanozoon TaxID=39700 RepID=Q383J7_TRYB2|nr:protein kinase ck2 regulatory subunit, putative [Trypanosoma brucei gambiense DAL972]XP_829146.1 protein kinase ck2 regulatory subunit, putative [Trypanosoma brucei brucei TREU927]RHW67516.1 Casein kinase II subunit beta [Trypanosoma brucei equiperdum]SCU68566.1 Casein kinase II subunit beta, putative [Trypanosoma equiperdum]EAN80034.1 protein kinase ck2 regulatory subunit, putative [Trypanosoma brucei brucei TREU927]CBH18094.1 protein kinase ck2 regulatory subunit, putative [Trypanosoma br|eukprot:XP_011780358.1 protein kinase ck2 regulatory subunit, putative [Trypanosoma brucei gambiense DAL972]